MAALAEPERKRVHAFFDCQNLFRVAKNLWPKHTSPDFDPVALARAIVKTYPQWVLEGIHLYTGIHTPQVNLDLHTFWSRKLATHKSQDSRVTIFTRPLRYSSVPNHNNSTRPFSQAREKGIDIRIALDLVRRARLREYDVALLFSQDEDFKEVAEEIRAIANEHNRWIKIASAFPSDEHHKRGVDKTDWIEISKALFESCLDPNTQKYYSE